MSFRTPEDTELTANPAELLGDVFARATGARVTLAANVDHGSLTLASDGSFTYRPHRGWVGADSFRYVLTVGNRTSAPVDVALTIYRVTTPSPSPSSQFAIGSTTRDGPNSPGVALGSLGPLSFSFEWLIPSLVVSGPGLLVLLVIGAQLLAGAAWLPLVRRNLGEFGLASRRRRRPEARP